jgi:hypothetical protein
MTVGGGKEGVPPAAQAFRLWTELPAHGGGLRRMLSDARRLDLEPPPAGSEEAFERRQGGEGRSGLVSGEGRLGGASPGREVGLREARLPPGDAQRFRDRGHALNISI